MLVLVLVVVFGRLVRVLVVLLGLVRGLVVVVAFVVVLGLVRLLLVLFGLFVRCVLIGRWLLLRRRLRCRLCAPRRRLGRSDDRVHRELFALRGQLPIASLGFGGARFRAGSWFCSPRRVGSRWFALCGGLFGAPSFCALGSSSPLARRCLGRRGFCRRRLLSPAAFGRGRRSRLGAPSTVGRGHLRVRGDGLEPLHL